MGELLIDPLPPSPLAGPQAPWQYQVDLDTDGDADASGAVSERVAVPYRFEEIGPHRIEVMLERGAERETREEFVVVNDLPAIEVLSRAEIPVGFGQSTDVLTGIVVDRTGERVYVAGVSAFPQPLFIVDARSMIVLERVDLTEPQGALEALAIAPGEDFLFVISKGFDLTVFTLPDLGLFRFIDPVNAWFHLHALPGKRVYVSGGGNGSSFALVDADEGSIVRDLMINNSRHFAVSPEGSTIALLTESGAKGPHELILLSAEDFMPRWRVDLKVDPNDLPPNAFSQNNAVAFSMDGGRIYVTRAIEGLERWEFLVLDAADGAILRVMTIGFGCVNVHCAGLANPVAISPNGRLAAFSTGIGAFFVDRTLDLPLYRTPFLEQEVYCCSVAASPVGDEFYFSSFFGGQVTKVRIRD
ncbi:MAG: hypothetical protein ACREK7_00145 [Gemmatimonadota bacterium]